MPSDEIEVNISVSEAYNLVPTFDGNPEALNKFIACGNILFSSTKSAAHTQIFLEVVKTRLQGPAFELIQYKSISTWAKLTSELEKHFKDVKSRASAQNELLAAKQMYKESVKEYGDRISNLLSALDSATYSSITDEGVRTYLIQENSNLAVQTFEDGLKNHSLRLLVKAHGETDIRKAIAYAIEQSLRLERNQLPPPVPLRHHPRPMCKHCGREGHSTERCYRNTNFPQFIQKQHKNVQFLTCTYCKKNNHSYQDCRLRLSRYPNEPRSSYRSQRNSGCSQSFSPNHNTQYNRNPNPRETNHKVQHVPLTNRPTKQIQSGETGNSSPREAQVGTPSRVTFKADIHQPNPPQ